MLVVFHTNSVLFGQYFEVFVIILLVFWHFGTIMVVFDLMLTIFRYLVLELLVVCW